MAQKDKKPHLGKGLNALLGDSFVQDIKDPKASDNTEFPVDVELKSRLCELPISRIQPNPYQPRKQWNDKELEELATSIKVKGLLQPVLVRKAVPGKGRKDLDIHKYISGSKLEGEKGGDKQGGRVSADNVGLQSTDIEKKGDFYELIAGERRYRAAEMAGLEVLPAIVRAASDEEMFELALVENIHREDLNPVDRAMAYRQYLDQFGLTHADGAQRLGEDRSVITNYLRLLDLPKEIQTMLVEKDLSMGHARALLSISSDELKKKIAVMAMTDKLSVREVERIVRQKTEKGKAPREPKEEKDKPSHIVDLENAFRDRLGTKVSISTGKGGQKGKIVIEFYSLDEFDRISEKMGMWYEPRGPVDKTVRIRPY